jgi:hypothetical protein
MLEFSLDPILKISFNLPVTETASQASPPTPVSAWRIFPSPAGSVTTGFQEADVQIDGHLTDRTWMLAAIVALPPIAFVAAVVLAYVVWRTW